MESESVQKTEQLLSAVAAGSDRALDELLSLHRDYLRRLVEYRIDPRLLARVDPSDIVQEVLVQVSQRISEFIELRPFSFRVWLRCKAMDGLADQQRRHVKAQKRSVRREQSINDVSSMAIAQKLMLAGSHKKDPQRELSDQVRAAMEQLSEADREILLLRYAEELNTAEIAELLGIDPDTARKRHGRAIQRLYRQLVESDSSDLPPRARKS